MNIDSYSVYSEPVYCCLLDIITFKVLVIVLYVKVTTKQNWRVGDRMYKNYCRDVALQPLFYSSANKQIYLVLANIFSMSGSCTTREIVGLLITKKGVPATANFSANSISF